MNRYIQGSEMSDNDMDETGTGNEVNTASGGGSAASGRQQKNIGGKQKTGVQQKTVGVQQKKEQSKNEPKVSRKDPLDQKKTQLDSVTDSLGKLFLLNWRQYMLVAIIAVLVSCVVMLITRPSQSLDSRNVLKKVENIQRDVAAANEAMKDLRTDSNTYTTAVDRMGVDVKSVKKDVAFKSQKLDDLQRDLLLSTEKTTTKLEEFRQGLNKKLEAMKSEYEMFEETVNTMQQEVKKSEQSLKDSVKSDMDNIGRQLQETLDGFSEKIEDIGNKYQTMETDVEREIKTLQSNLDSASDLIKKAEKTKQDLAEEVKNRDDIVELLRVNAFNKGAMLAVVLFLVVAVFALTIAVWTICRRLSSGSHSNGTGQGTGIFGGRRTTHGPIVNRVPDNPPLEKAICIISYSEDRKTFNNRLVDGLMSQLSPPFCSLQVRHHVINRHEDIVSLPHCRLILMCVEFSSRHVIIEEPGIAQGDIRRTTYQAVQKLGATLVILYTRDHDSKNMKNARYHRDIYCVGSQPELKELNEDHCFYSVFERFSPHQVDCLKAVVERVFQ